MKPYLLALIVFICCQVNVVSASSSFSVTSKLLDNPPKVTIHLPLSYKQGNEKHYPVLYMLDGDLNGIMADGMIKRLHGSNGAYEHIVVGLQSTDRLHDFAPTVNRDPRGPVGQGGGGDAFLDYVEKELMPAINSKYQTNGHNVIAGHSVGGLLVLHSFQSRPHLFQAHMAFSPAIWWGEQETRRATEAYVMSNRGIKSFLYMNIGNESGALRDVYDEFTNFMVRNRTLDLKLHTDKFDKVSHDFTIVSGMYNALKSLHGYQKTLGM